MTWIVVLIGLVLALVPSGERRVVADGHVDIGLRAVDGGWRLQLQDGSVDPPAWRDLSDVVLHAGGTAAATVPADPRFRFLGEPGAPVWLLPQSQRPGVVWPGWNTRDPALTGPVTWELHDVAGPGHFALFVSGNFGRPEVLFDSARGFPQRTALAAGTHAHGNWAYSAPGDYVLDIEMRAGPQVGDRRSLRVHVGDGDPTSAFAAGSAGPVLVGGGVGAVVLIGGAALVLWARRTRNGRAE